MTRLLAPYIVPITGALFGLIVALSIALWWSITSHTETRAALQMATQYIQGRTETDNALSNVPDDPDALLERLQSCANGGPCSRDP